MIVFGRILRYKINPLKIPNLYQSSYVYYMLLRVIIKHKSVMFLNSTLDMLDDTRQRINSN